MVGPPCGCHGEPTYWHKKKDARAGGIWRCRIRRRALDAKRWQAYYYERMPATVRIPRELDTRRRNAMARRAQRQGGVDG